MTGCIVQVADGSSCGKTTAGYITVRLPKWIGPDTMIVDEARDHELPVCAKHQEILNAPPEGVRVFVKDSHPA